MLFALQVYTPLSKGLIYSIVNIDLTITSLEVLTLVIFILELGMIALPFLNQVMLARGREYTEHSNLSDCPTFTTFRFTFREINDNIARNINVEELLVYLN